MPATRKKKATKRSGTRSRKQPPRKPAFKRPKKKEDPFTVDIPEGALGKGRRIPENTYRAKCTSVKADTSEAGNPMYVWDFVITKGKYAGKDLRCWTAKTDDAIWKVVEVLNALGVPAEEGKKITFKPKDVIGVMCLIDVRDDSYQGREQSKIQRVKPWPEGAGSRSPHGGKSFSPEEFEDDEDVEDEDEFEEEEDEDDEEDDEEEEDEDEEDDDEEDEEEYEEDEDEEDEDEEDEDEEDEEDEEEEPEPPKRRAAKKSSGTRTLTPAKKGRGGKAKPKLK